MPIIYILIILYDKLFLKGIQRVYVWPSYILWPHNGTLEQYLNYNSNEE